MKVELVTKDDLQEFKAELLSELKKIITPNSQDQNKAWLKSRDVRKMLEISPGKLTSLRMSKQLPFVRLGGNIYYDREDVHRLFEKNKSR